MPERQHRARWVIAIVLAVIVAAPLAVIASDAFNDVPNANVFHGSITWLRDNGVTAGCNPPANDEFCPKDNVTREQMAAFMRRFAQTSGNVGAQVTDFDSDITTTGITFVEVLSIEVTPKAEASVTLNAHAALEKPTSTEGRYEALIARGSCTGTVVGSGWWRGNVNSEASFEANTISFTGSDVVSTTTTYVLCVAEGVASSPDATVSRRGLTATWSPTA